jgi:hypothetical protein
MTLRQHSPLALAILLAACGGGEPEKPKEAAAPATFPAGEWEVTTATESLKSTDGSTPATTHSVGATKVARVCAAPGPKPDPALFAETGDTCTAATAYARDGRVNLVYNCERPARGQVAVTVDGNYDANSFEVVSAIGSYFKADGDYSMNQRLKGKRLGECTAPTASG